MKLATDRHSGEEYAVKIMALPEPNAKAGDNENTRYSACAVPSALSARFCTYMHLCIHLHVASHMMHVLLPAVQVCLNIVDNHLM